MYQDEVHITNHTCTCQFPGSFSSQTCAFNSSVEGETIQDIRFIFTKVSWCQLTALLTLTFHFADFIHLCSKFVSISYAAGPSILQCKSCHGCLGPYLLTCIFWNKDIPFLAEWGWCSQYQLKKFLKGIRRIVTEENYKVVRVLTGNVGLWKSSLKTVSRSLKSLCSGVSYLPSHKSRPPIKAVIFRLFPVAWVSTITHFWWCVNRVPTTWRGKFTWGGIWFYRTHEEGSIAEQWIITSTINDRTVTQ
jgi:hypothetical protein